MQDVINLTVNTKSGEDLYIYPYSVKYGEEQKLFYYCSPEFSVNNTNDFFEKYYSSPILSKLVLIKGVISNWWNYTIEDISYLFGNCFDKYFSDYTVGNYLKFIPCDIERSYVFPATSVFGKNISIRGQLKITTRSKYIVDYYLTPTADYFHERLEEWINEVNYQEFTDKFIDKKYFSEEETQKQIEYETNFRREYKKWRDTESAKGNEIEYLYSLDT